VKVGYEVTKDGIFRLTVFSENMGVTMPAGWRLQKGVSLPINDFEYFDEKTAKEAVEKLQEYVDENNVKRHSKKKGRK
jgi:hypothetical protein